MAMSVPISLSICSSENVTAIIRPPVRQSRVLPLGSPVSAALAGGRRDDRDGSGGSCSSAAGVKDG
ncbi:hypothetical protein GCM10011374_07390 [Kocuria dechangensis]|uniref:Uncharacterized protein n=1 Tax=Kocuria dechangensis TaxID=1176249 RepID=A0A917GIU7_9MICC|nr:hypothetical protein GCM10011374_07390 [Kocuria dechangensis]